MHKSLLSSKTEHWQTPLELFAEYDSVFSFTLDVCSCHAYNWQLCRRYLTSYENGLTTPWTDEVCWMNPPYGRQIAHWIKKAYTESRENGAIVVGLLPAITDTRWFHEYIYGVTDIRFLQGRIKFELWGNVSHPAPFPSMVVVWDKAFKFPH